MKQDQQPYYVGIDGGGTKCRAVMFNHKQQVVGTGLAGPANVARYGIRALHAMVDAVHDAIQNSDAGSSLHCEDLHVSAGLAGANLSEARLQLNEWRHPFKCFSFTSDLHTALLGAHAGADGAVLIVGTGSCAAALKDETLTQIGGHGFLLGDKGSGAWLGKQALTLTLETLDKAAPLNVLSEQVCKRFATHSPLALVERFNSAMPSTFAQLAPLVLQCAIDGDPQALKIVRDGADYLSTIAQEAISQSDGDLVLVGGVAQPISRWLSSSVRERIVAARKGPEWGAYFYQTKQHNMKEKSV
ncbi:BadF/BadG/BcrA/BcrD ATPase family protein [Alteromonas oceanisediminis]|uniref:BadF/BadG/BcrA/BcrD ATPase family protein n=1 Tax=Alteromonas oceanisediminis TaxID=2836180 RepID=UPI001BDAE54B|nr:BadF/BadG/BcrA/BcrD ATPase family protein [Alteromonas oceanisediminis]MBT0586788.1 hypothetical protein [Alteromonas oceanisediminis]